MIENITPIILTYNEAPNVGRTLERLRWARDIVVVDSFSDDETLSLVANFPQARVFQRKFDCHENQWNYALKETNIRSEWVLALDADYVLTARLVEELKELRPVEDISGYEAEFIYCVMGHELRGSAYPPVTVLYRHEKALYRHDGHTQRIAVDGRIRKLRSPILHDDQKSLTRWLQSQDKYMKLEAGKLLESDDKNLNWADRLRRTRFVAPFVMLFYCLFIKRAILDGRAGFYYALQRLLAETLLSLHLIEHDLSKVRSTESKKEATLSGSNQIR